MIRKYRQKPIVIEAIQFNGNNESEIIEFTKSITSARPECLKSMRIPTFEGDMIVYVGDWVIKDVNGYFYQCKSDIFEKHYEMTEQEEDEAAEEWEKEKQRRIVEGL